MLPVVGLCSVDMWSQRTQLPPNGEPWSVAAETGATWASAYGRGEAERMMAVGVMLIMIPLVSSGVVAGAEVLTRLETQPRSGRSGQGSFSDIAERARGGKSDVVDLALFAVGWTLGWLLLWRLRPLPPKATTERPAVAIVIPARNEADALPHLLPALAEQLRDGDELIVVDDHSSDATGDVATGLGARAVMPPDLPEGWLGKPHACWQGARSTEAPLLLFVDADVRPAPDLLDRVAVACSTAPGSVVSVQPWHQTAGWVEQASLLANITALMGSGAFTIAGPRVAATMAFGPVLAIDRSTYDDVGGHAAVRTMHTEDIGLARSVGSSRVYSGRPDTAFRMYPEGFGQLVQGWTRSIATGARFAPWWVSLAVALWVWSLAGGWLAEPVVYPLSALQFWVLGRRAGSMHPVTALLYPLAVAVFAWIFLRSLFAIVFRRQVTWKLRSVAARPD